MLAQLRLFLSALKANSAVGIFQMCWKVSSQREQSGCREKVSENKMVYFFISILFALFFFSPQRNKTDCLIHAAEFSF